MSSPAITTASLEAFSAAWNRHDVDALMAFMHPECVFQMAGGPDACGTRQSGPEAVRKAFASAWINVPDAQWLNGKHFVQGDFGVSEWTFVGTAADGTRIETERRQHADENFTRTGVIIDHQHAHAGQCGADAFKAQRHIAREVGTPTPGLRYCVVQA